MNVCAYECKYHNVGLSANIRMEKHSPINMCIYVCMFVSVMYVCICINVYAYLS